MFASFFSIVREHPAIGHAVMNIAASVNEEAAHSARSGSVLGQDAAFGQLQGIISGSNFSLKHELKYSNLLIFPFPVSFAMFSEYSSKAMSSLSSVLQISSKNILTW